LPEKKKSKLNNKSILLIPIPDDLRDLFAVFLALFFVFLLAYEYKKDMPVLLKGKIFTNIFVVL
jgi:hypothetical protein